MSKSELACVYACLALHDDGVEITVSWGRSGGSDAAGTALRQSMHPHARGQAALRAAHQAPARCCCRPTTSWP